MTPYGTLESFRFGIHTRPRASHRAVLARSPLGGSRSRHQRSARRSHFRWTASDGDRFSFHRFSLGFFIQSLRRPGAHYPILAGASIALLLFSGLLYYFLYTIAGIAVTFLFFAVASQAHGWDLGSLARLTKRGAQVAAWAIGFAAASLIPFAQTADFVDKDADTLLTFSQTVPNAFLNFLVSDPNYYSTAHRGMPGRLALAKQFGADNTIDLNDLKEPAARVQKVMELTGGRGADVVAEFVGMPAVIPEGLMMTRAGGTYLEIGNISFGRTVEIDPSALVWGSKRIIGVVMYDPWVIPQALDYLVRTKNKYPHEEVVSHDKYKLADINKAFEEAEWQKEGEGTKVRRAVILP